MGIRFSSGAGYPTASAVDERVNIEENDLQRLFSTFPGGWAGAGLLLLRTMVGSTILIQPSLIDLNSATPWAIVAALLSIISAIGLIAGFLTPAAGTVAALATLAQWWLLAPANGPFDAVPQAVLLAAVAVAVALSGPGAFSVDARLFGRREIVIPPVGKRANS